MMYFLLIGLFFFSNDAIMIARIHRSALYYSNSSCAFLWNVTMSNDSSIQNCIWECHYEDACKTAVYYRDEQICSLFDEDCVFGSIEPSDLSPASVICYRKSQGKSVLPTWMLE